MANTSITLNLDPKVKAEFDSIAQSLGLTPNAAINIFIRHFIDHRGFPFPITHSENKERRFAQ